MEVEDLFLRVQLNLTLTFTENMFNPVLTSLNSLFIKSSIQLHCYKSSLELHYVVSNVTSGQCTNFF